MGLVDELLQLGHLAHLFVGKDLVLLVAIDSYTSGVVATVLEAGETWSVVLNPVHRPGGVVQKRGDSPLMRVSRMNLRSFSTR